MGAVAQDLSAQRLERLMELGTALSAERDTDRLLERILESAQELTGADAGTLYRVAEEGDRLEFLIVRNDTLGLRLGGVNGDAVTFPDLPLYDKQGGPNHANVAAYVALTGQTVRIADAYQAEGFDFSGTKAVDQRTGYRSQSFLTVALRNHEEKVIGVLQLINAVDREHGQVVAFQDADERLVEALASQAAAAWTQRSLIDAQRELFGAFTEAIARAIDRKNPATAGHCVRVPELTMMIADACCRAESGPLAEVDLDPEQYYELQVAAWLHDCGKITTPEAVVNKSTKLDRQADGIREIEARAAGILRQLEAEEGSDGPRAHQLQEDIAFLREANLGGEFMRDEDLERIDRIAAEYEWIDVDGRHRPLLEPEERENLRIRRGTLNEAEFGVMREHATVTLEMLEALPYPRDLARVPEIAGQHHERMDGKGYPRGIGGDAMTLRARMVAVADVFEALTAADRPYKPGKSLSQALGILAAMGEEGHLDPALCALFIREGVYRRYAERYLKPEQCDAVDEQALLERLEAVHAPEPAGV